MRVNVDFCFSSGSLHISTPEHQHILFVKMGSLSLSAPDLLLALGVTKHAIRHSGTGSNDTGSVLWPVTVGIGCQYRENVSLENQAVGFPLAAGKAFLGRGKVDRRR